MVERQLRGEPVAETGGGEGLPPSYLRSRHVAELIADDLRRQILDSDLSDGDLLPKQEDLVNRYGASRPSVREALRILETEGLISVRRGKFGGAIVHKPGAQSVAHTISMVLRSRRASADDLSVGLRHIEPICAALCAAREDRHETVIPKLQAQNERARATIDDPRSFTTVSRRFHEELVASCGNLTATLVVGALETVWSAHAEVWADRNVGHGLPDLTQRQRGLDDHELLVRLIDAGDVDGATREAKRHLSWVPVYTVDERNRIDPGLLVGHPQPP